MFEACLRLLGRATETFAAVPNVLVFRPETPGTKDGPRIWNTQLLRFAGYRESADEHILGDPNELGFAQILETEMGWVPPDPKSGMNAHAHASIPVCTLFTLQVEHTRQCARWMQHST